MKKTFFVGACLVVWAVLALGSVWTYAEDLCPLTTESVTEASGGLLVCSLSTAISGDHTQMQWYVTTSGYLAAVEEELLDRAIFWVGVGDEQEFMRFVTSTDLVFPLKSGLRVHIEKFSFSGKVRIRPEGSTISVWTVREAIRSELPSNDT